MTFAETLKAGRKASGLTQAQMSEQMEIPKRTIEDWEREIAVPPEYVQRFVLKELEEIASKKE